MCVVCLSIYALSQQKHAHIQHTRHSTHKTAHILPPNEHDDAGKKTRARNRRKTTTTTATARRILSSTRSHSLARDQADPFITLRRRRRWRRRPPHLCLCERVCGLNMSLRIDTSTGTCNMGFRHAARTHVLAHALTHSLGRARAFDIY